MSPDGKQSVGISIGRIYSQQNSFCDQDVNATRLSAERDHLKMSPLHKHNNSLQSSNEYASKTMGQE